MEVSRLSGCRKPIRGWRGIQQCRGGDLPGTRSQSATAPRATFCDVRAKVPSCIIARDSEQRGVHDANENDRHWTWTLSAFGRGTTATGKKGCAKGCARNDPGSSRDRSQEIAHGTQRQASTQRSGNVFDDPKAKGQLQHRPRYWRYLQE